MWAWNSELKEKSTKLKSIVWTKIRSRMIQQERRVKEEIPSPSHIRTVGITRNLSSTEIS